MVVSRVLTPTQKSQVFGPVVQSIAVDVVDDLTAQELAAQQPLHNNAVLVAPTATFSHLHYPVGMPALRLVQATGSDPSISRMPTTRMSLLGVWPISWARTVGRVMAVALELVAPIVGLAQLPTTARA